MFFKRLIKARTNTNLKFVVTKQLEEYAEQSVSSIYYLLLEGILVKHLTIKGTYFNYVTQKLMVRLLPLAYSVLPLVISNKSENDPQKLRIISLGSFFRPFHCQAPFRENRNQ